MRTGWGGILVLRRREDAIVTRAIVKRLWSSLAVLFVVSLLTFFVLMRVPGDAAQLILGTEATPDKVAALREAMGLNLPWHRQYLNWIGGVLSGDWGTSYLFGENVAVLIRQRLPVTFSVAILSMLIAIPLASLFGVLAALNEGSWIDSVSRTLMQFGVALPSFWLSMLFMLVFSGKLRWFPVTGYVPPGDGLWPFLKSIALPSLALVLGETGILIRIIRSSMLSALKQDFMQSARAKGLPRATAIVKYALRSAIIAPITVAGMQFARLLGGTVVVESIFALPGIGRLLLTAVEQRDVVLLQGVALFVTGMVVLVSFAADCLVLWANPTIRTEGGGTPV